MRAENEWDRVVNTALRYGMAGEEAAYRDLSVNPDTARAVAKIGWQRICCTPIAWLFLLREAFVNSYNGVETGIIVLERVVNEH